LSEHVISLFGHCGHLLNYIDLPLQHISDKILKSMNRKVTSDEIRKKIQALRTASPGIAIRTTFLVGYPGETEKDFEELCRFIKETEFTRLGVFPYCPEERTPAASMPDQVPLETAQERCDEIMRIQAEISLANNQKLTGTEMKVMVDFSDPETATAFGRTYMDAPEIDNIVEISGAEGTGPGDFINVIIEKVSEFQLYGHRV
jgi:ribosomal protein S12 methylthiotransferase